MYLNSAVPFPFLSIPFLLVASTSHLLAEGELDFVRDIRPILSDTCFQCHGPDEDKRQADLRLDLELPARADLDGNPLITSGDLEKSELYLRVTSSDPDLQMPPPTSDRQLTSIQKELIKQWIKRGANWESHWAFSPPLRPTLPEVANSIWPKNGIDHFILRRLEKEGLSVSPASEKRTLIRRVTLDLTGLPPTPAEVNDFLADDSPRAYERVVDRLLKSPRYGEHMAGEWLDVARYADTSGYQNDGPREMWRWRDWVINAFNDNKRFDEFTIEQIAGDMLPNATLSQQIATGFNRNHRGNAEGGIIPEEFQVEYVVDRVETTATVWLGLTLGCARCHDHKYDPFSQAEFYQFYALFNNIPEHGRAVKEGNSPPYISAPTHTQQQRLNEMEERLQELSREVKRNEPALREALTKWESENNSDKPFDSLIDDGLVRAFSFEETPSGFVDGQPEFAKHGDGQAVVFDGQRHLVAGDVANFGYFDKFSFSFWVNPTSNERGTIVSRMEDVHRSSGYSIRLTNGGIAVDLVKRWLDDSIRVETVDAMIPTETWSHVAVTYDGSRVAAGIRVFVDGVLQSQQVNLDYINQSFAADDAPLRIGAGHGVDGRFSGMIDELRIYEKELTPAEVKILSEPVTVAEILKIRRNLRTTTQFEKLRYWYLRTHAPQRIQEVFIQHRNSQRELQQYQESLPTVMVMQELKERRPTFILKRGEYDKPGGEVTPGIPDALVPQKESISDRLTLARWLVAPGNPLTARVTVNRLWQQIFGTGIVKTSEDFGSQGALPTHPELLDWLATELIRLDWDLKAFLKLVVLSSTYQQSSVITENHIKLDPENRLLARSPRLRLTARMLRDQALLVSGLLQERRGGPSVKPYQPDGLWKEIATTTNYEQSTGPDLYRRSLYTYWKRTVAPPNMAIFDAAGREMCVVRSSRTNTPLQALAVMNDITFLEAARVLAERAFREAEADHLARINHAFLLATARFPDREELKILAEAYEHHLVNFQNNLDAATALISHGDSELKHRLDKAELAAMTIVTSTILNLDEVINKE